MEYVYRLNLPAIEDILLPGKYEELFKPTNLNSYMSNIDSKTYLKQEYKVVNNYTLDYSLLFYKANGQIGVIHSDGDTVWAINYIVGGTGKMHYYDPNKLGKPKVIQDPEGNLRPVYRGDDTVESERAYMMPEGIYLVRTDLPHLPIGYGKRYCLSIRATEEQMVLPWDTVVNSFKQYIIE